MAEQTGETVDSIEVLLDRVDRYAGIHGDQLILTYVDHLAPKDIRDMIMLSMDRGFYWLRYQYFDVDLDRQVAIFERTRS